MDTVAGPLSLTERHCARRRFARRRIQDGASHDRSGRICSICPQTYRRRIACATLHLESTVRSAVASGTGRRKARFQQGPAMPKKPAARPSLTIAEGSGGNRAQQRAVRGRAEGSSASGRTPRGSKSLMKTSDLAARGAPVGPASAFAPTARKRTGTDRKTRRPRGENRRAHRGRHGRACQRDQRSRFRRRGVAPRDRPDRQQRRGSSECLARNARHGDQYDHRARQRARPGRTPRGGVPRRCNFCSETRPTRSVRGRVPSSRTESGKQARWR